MSRESAQFLELMQTLAAALVGLLSGLVAGILLGILVLAMTGLLQGRRRP
jgi:ABC-type nitrate/sulfonate/bicarbonate transport system permease component